MWLWFARWTLPLPNCLVRSTPGGASRAHLSPETLHTIPSQSLHLTDGFWYKKYCGCQKSSAMRRCFTSKYKNEGPCFFSLSKTDFMVAGVHFLDVFHLVQHMFGLKCCSRQNPSHGFTFFFLYSHRLLLISSKSSIQEGIAQAKGRKQNYLLLNKKSCTNKKCLTFGMI